MITTTTMRLIVLISIATVINAYPDPKADASVLKIQQYIVHRIGKSPFKSCHKDSECTEPHQACINYYCKCKNGFMQTDDYKCVGGLGGDCEADKDCKDPHAICNQEKKCECPFGYVTYEGYCYERRAYGEECECDPQCPGSNYACVSGHCGCSKQALYLAGLGCQAIRVVPEECIADKQCDKGTPNSECNTYCECEEDFQLNNAEDACVPKYCTVTLEIISDQTWNSDWADDSTGEYATNLLFWKNILIDAGILDENIDTDSLVFEQEGAGTKITVDVIIEHTGVRKRSALGKSRNRRDLEESVSGEEKEESLAAEIAEGMKKDAYKDTLTELLMKREIKELETPITISIPSLSDGNLLLDGFCLQNKDCDGNFAMCFENKCN